MSLQNPTTEPTLYREYKAELHEGNNLFRCDRAGCDTLVGDPRTANFLGRCPGCHTIVRFQRIIE